MKIVLIESRKAWLVSHIDLVAKIPAADLIVFTAAEDAMAYLLTHAVSMIIVEYSLPGITGIELTKRMRASDRHQHTPIILVAPLLEEALRRRAAEVGVTECLIEPINASTHLPRLVELSAIRYGTPQPVARRPPPQLYEQTTIDLPAPCWLTPAVSFAHRSRASRSCYPSQASSAHLWEADGRHRLTLRGNDGEYWPFSPRGGRAKLDGSARGLQTSIFSAISIASSISIPR